MKIELLKLNIQDTHFTELVSFPISFFIFKITKSKKKKINKITQTFSHIFSSHFDSLHGNMESNIKTTQKMRMEFHIVLFDRS